MLLIGRYIPDATGAIYDVLKEMAQMHASKKKRYEDDDANVLRKVSSHLITKQTLSEKLAKHVEQVSSLISCFSAKTLNICPKPPPYIVWNNFLGRPEY